MYWMFEPRSKYWYDDDEEGGSYSLPMKLHEILLLPIYAILMLVFFAILEIVIIPAGIIYHDFSETVKRVSESGELEFPGLLYTGIILTIILVFLIANRMFSVSDHPFITICSSIFILIFTLAPLTGLAVRNFKKQ